MAYFLSPRYLLYWLIEPEISGLIETTHYRQGRTVKAAGFSANKHLM
jgi:hypothetical protein